jgi:hypothetical protein
VEQEETKKLNALLNCAIQIVGRLALPPESVREIIGTDKKYMRAYNLCDGSRTQQEIAKATGLHQSNFSRASGRWVENGVAFWLGEGKDKRLRHLYPIPAISRKKRIDLTV